MKQVLETIPEKVMNQVQTYHEQIVKNQIH